MAFNNETLSASLVSCWEQNSHPNCGDRLNYSDGTYPSCRYYLQMSLDNCIEAVLLRCPRLGFGNVLPISLSEVPNPSIAGRTRISTRSLVLGVRFGLGSLGIVGELYKVSVGLW